MAFEETNIRIGKWTCQKQMDSTLSVVQIDIKWFYSCEKKHSIAISVPGFVCTLTQMAARAASMKVSIWNVFHQKFSMPLRRLFLTFSWMKISGCPDTLLVSTVVWIKITSFYNIWFICVNIESIWTKDFWILMLVSLKANSSSDLTVK